MSEDKELEMFKFEEEFKVSFFIGTTDYNKAKKIYDQMFDRNIKLGYDNWKVEDIEMVGGKFLVQTINSEGFDENLIDTIDEAEAIKEAEAMNWRAGIGLKWAEDWETSIDHNAEGVFICSEHKQEECQDDECYEEYEELESAGKI